MKQTKMDVTLSEKDALQDMLDIEKLIMSYYAAALLEGSSKPFRKEILKNYTASADTQFAIFTEMLEKGYYKVQPADGASLEETSKTFSKSLKQIS